MQNNYKIHCEYKISVIYAKKIIRFNNYGQQDNKTMCSGMILNYEIIFNQN